MRAVLARVGTPPVSAALVVLGVAYVAVAELWAQVDRGAAGALSASVAYQALAAALAVDAAVALARALSPAAPARDRSRPARHRVVSLLVRAGYLLAALGFVASVAMRDRLEVRVAVGEQFDGSPEQFVGRDPVRPMAAGPFAATFVVEAVDAGAVSATTLREVSLRMRDGALRRARSLPLWFGWGRFLLPLETGWAVRYEIATGAGAPLETAFAKLELLPPGSVDGIRALAVPYQFHVRLATAGADAPVPSAIEAAVYRGKLALADGAVAPGERLDFEGLSVGFPEARRWVRFAMIHDPGIPLTVAGALLAALALLLGARRRHSA